MAEIGTFTPEQARRIWAAARAVERMTGSTEAEVNRPQSPLIYFRNDSESTIPPYGCIKITGTVDDDQNYLTVTQPDAPDGVQGPFIFNGAEEVLADEYGVAQAGPIFRAILTGSITFGQLIGPKASAFEVSLGGAYVYLGTDDIADNIIKIRALEGPVLGHTTGAGLASGAVGVMYRKLPGSGGWTTDTGTEYPAWTGATAIDAAKDTIGFPIDGRLFWLEIC